MLKEKKPKKQITKEKQVLIELVDLRKVEKYNISSCVCYYMLILARYHPHPQNK